MTLRGLGLLSLVALSSACSQLLGDLKVAGEGGGDASLHHDGGARDLTSGSDALPPDCDPAAVPVAGAVFASGRSGTVGAKGTAEAPVAGVLEALTAARGGGAHHVYLDEGSYPEQLDLVDYPGGVTVHGGWVRDAGAWHPDCAAGARDRTVIASPGNFGVRLTSVTSGFGLERLRIATGDRKATAPDTAGHSRIALHVRGGGSKVTLTDVALVAGSADPGGEPSAVAAGTTSTCDGVLGCLDGADGPAGTPGADATDSGAFSASGFGPADGQPGATPGQGGHDGAPGDPAEQAMCVDSCSCKNDCSSMDAAVEVAAGRCGCGGGGGEPGHAGRGGGASVALLAADARTTVTLAGCALVAGDGGDGSAGGAGGAGGPPSMGSGAPGLTCHSGGCVATIVLNMCGTCDYADPLGKVVGPHKAGGVGGVGGVGGAGGGGAGGPSYGIVTVGKAGVEADGATQVTPGRGGKGGGGGKAGDQGARLDV